MDRIDQAGQSGLVGLIAEVPFGSPEEPSMAEHPGTPRHAREPEVGGVGQHGGHQNDRILRYRAGAQVDEALKTSPAVDLGEKFGNSDARQHTVEAPCDIIDIRVVLPDRADRQPRLGDQRLGKFARRGECGHFPERRSRVSRRSSPQASKRSGTASPNSPACRLAANAAGGSKKSSKAWKARLPRESVVNKSLDIRLITVRTLGPLRPYSRTIRFVYF